MVRFSVLGSGSSGNSYIFEFKDSSILIDNGFSRRELLRRMAQEGFEISKVKAIFVTHMHPDHCNGVGVLARNDDLPVYISSNTKRYCTNELKRLNVPENLLFVISSTVQIGDFSIKAFSTSHDSAGSVGYHLWVDNQSFTLVTDTGIFNDQMIEMAKESKVLFLESNYEPDMLRNGPYPMPLKRRISSERGHLSNIQAQEFLIKCGFIEDYKNTLCYNLEKSKIEKVFLIHLSGTNNDVNLLEQRYENMTKELVVVPKLASVSSCIGE